MSSVRLLIQYAPLNIGSVLKLSQEDSKYLFNVLRMKNGELIEVTDGKGSSFLAELVNSHHLKILEKVQSLSENSFSLFLCQALLKGDKMDMVVQKATELGVRKIIPFFSERSILKNTRKVDRWQKIAKEATEQSGRSLIPEISDVQSYKNLIENAENGIVFWEDSQESLTELFKYIDINNPLSLFIGPEGGFTKEEIKIAEDKGLKIASLGKRILRAETAAIAALAIVNFLMENYAIIKK